MASASTAIIDLNNVETSVRLKQILEDSLRLGEATHTDVIAFLKEQNVGFSPILNRDNSNFGSIADQFAELSGQPFDTLIACKIRLKRRWRPRGRWFWQQVWSWVEHQFVWLNCFIQFHFNNGKLVEIVTVTVASGL